MAKKKKQKFKRQPSVPAGELVKLAEEYLQQGRTREALNALQRAESEIKRVSSVSGKAVPLPPSLAAAQMRISPLMARALFESALASTEHEKKITGLEEAIRRDPSEARYQLALGACRLSEGKPEQALELFQKARALSPDDAIVERALVVGLLATNRTREVKERTKGLPEADSDPHLKRLGTIRDLLVGNFSQTGATKQEREKAEERLGKDEGGRMKDEKEDLDVHPSSFILHPSRHPSTPASQLIGGLLRLASGDEKGAEEELDDLPALDRNPSRAEAAILATQLFYSAALDFEQGRLKEAVAGFGEARSLARSHNVNLPWLERLAAYYHFLAERAVASGDLRLAAECWQGALALDAGDKTASANLEAAQRIEADRFWREGATDRAILLWTDMLKSRPHDEQLLKNMAVAYEKLGRKSEAVKHWLTLAQVWRRQIKSRSEDAQFKKRLLLLEQHLIKTMVEADCPYHQILNELDLALKIDPENPDLRLKHAEMYMEIGNPQKAIKHLEFIERKQGESPELLLQKATAYEMMDRYRLARKMVDRAYELAPSNPVVRRRYLIELGEDASEAVYDEDLDRALEICLKQLSIDPEYLPAAHRLTALYFYSGQKQKAKETIARVIEWEPDGAQNHVIAGRLYLEFEFKQEAKKAFARALEIDGSEDCLIRIGESYLATKSLKKALSYFESAVKSGSFDTFMKIASTLHEYDYDREAEKYIDRASEKDPSHPEPHLVKAVLLINRDKMEEAYEEMDEAERLAAERPEAEEISERVRSLMRSIERRKKLMEMIEEIGGPVRNMPPEILRMLSEIMEN